MSLSSPAKWQTIWFGFAQNNDEHLYPNKSYPPTHTQMFKDDFFLHFLHAIFTFLLWLFLSFDTTPVKLSKSSFEMPTSRSKLCAQKKLRGRGISAWLIPVQTEWPQMGEGRDWITQVVWNGQKFTRYYQNCIKKKLNSNVLEVDKKKVKKVQNEGIHKKKYMGE